jgi:hypothetical protein
MPERRKGADLGSEKRIPPPSKMDDRDRLSDADLDRTSGGTMKSTNDTQSGIATNIKDS